MSLRWRISGELLCGAKSKPMRGDTYIHDGLHYQLSLIGAIEPHADEAQTGLWRWRARGPYWAEENQPIVRLPDGQMQCMVCDNMWPEPDADVSRGEP